MIYFDNASTTMNKPECVIKASDYALKKLSANAGRGSHAAAIKAASLMYRARSAVQSITRCDNVIFTFNCTDALNTVLFGTAKPYGHIVTTVYEHNSVLRPLAELKRRLGIEFTAVRPRAHGMISPEDIERAIRPHTYMIIVNHASNVTGAVAPATSIGGVAKRHGLLYLIDGAQSVGYLETDMRAIGCDFLCFSPHKGLHGPQGLGCLCIRGNAEIKPFRFGGTGSSSLLLEQPRDIPDGLESGTLPVHSVFALIAAITHYKRLPRFAVRDLAECGEYIRSQLASIRGVKLYGSLAALPNIITFNIDGFNSSAVGDILSEQYDIAVRSGLHCAPLCHKYLGTQNTGAVRASLSYGNTKSEAEFFIKAVSEIAARG